MQGDLLILCYHAVSDRWPADLSVTPAAFEKQLRGLQRSGYQAITLSEVRTARPEKALVVTFDDGYLSTYTEAAPILARLRMPATLFVPSDYIGRGRPMVWPGIDQWLDSPYRDELIPLDWEKVQELAEAGWEIGSHTCSHPKLTRLPETELEREMTASRVTIETALRLPCTTIAYPYGDVDDRVAEAAATAGYQLGVGLPARWTPATDPMQLPRVGVYNGQSGLKLSLKTSRLVRRLRVATGR